MSARTPAENRATMTTVGKILLAALRRLREARAGKAKAGAGKG